MNKLDCSTENINSCDIVNGNKKIAYSTAIINSGGIGHGNDKSFVELLIQMELILRIYKHFLVFSMQI